MYRAMSSITHRGYANIQAYVCSGTIWTGCGSNRPSLPPIDKSQRIGRLLRAANAFFVYSQVYPNNISNHVIIEI